MKLWYAIGVWLLLALPAAAQQSGPPVLIIDSERLFFETQYGRRIASDLAARTAELQAENDVIVQQLTEEERSLTQRRATMDPAAFRDEAAAFDAKVQDVRRARDAKNGELAAEAAQARANFEDRVQEIVANLMLERGASMVLDQRNVILSVRAANITDAAIQRIDETLGDGAP
ncbi:OmpH family outer membrane protein [Yoonia vestfoldensis]|uniref:OmpH family outer membrane protein n=1 Tax=Yoonia vestfoldensis TaxID=245188 RepID=UPI000376EB6E|nr:OmpH family outer membrane protein [Yoonia vestfoldensis]